MANDVLVTGSAKGLGNYLHNKLGGLGLTRENSSDILRSNSTFSTIWHCAFSNPQQIATAENIELTKKLLKLKCNKFVFISSCDVYPENHNLHSESDAIDESSLRSDYGKQKLQCEHLVFSTHPDALVIRPTTMLSDHIRSRNIQRLLNDREPVLSLTESSTLNLIASEEVLRFVEIAQKNNLSGIYNLARSEAVSIGDLARALNKKCSFGDFSYNVSFISNKKAVAYLPSLDESSLNFFKKWIGS